MATATATSACGGTRSGVLSRVVGVEGVGTAFGAAVEGVGTAFGAAVEGAMTGVAGALPAHWLFSQAQPVKAYEEPSVHLHSMYRGEPQHWLTATLYPHLTWHCDLHADGDPSSHGAWPVGVVGVVGGTTARDSRSRRG